MKMCLTSYTHYINAYNEFHVNEFKWSLRFQNEINILNHLWKYVWWRTCKFERDFSLFSSSSNKIKNNYFSKNDVLCSCMH
jgi:hypothetical protein